MQYEEKKLLYHHILEKFISVVVPCYTDISINRKEYIGIGYCQQSSNLNSF